MKTLIIIGAVALYVVIVTVCVVWYFIKKDREHFKPLPFFVTWVIMLIAFPFILLAFIFGFFRWLFKR